MSLSSHQSATMKSDVWLTPRSILYRLGEFDLDPCSIDGHPWQIAPAWYTKEQDGLAQDWFGRVWLNPPFGDQAGKWLLKLADHGNGIALVAARTETRWFTEGIWKRAHAICFLSTRPYFHRADGTRGKANSGAPIVLAAYGAKNVSALLACELGPTLMIPRL